MMISTKGRYALRLMQELAICGANGKPVSLKEVAARQEISVKYLEQIISVLNKAGFVRSIRGPQGGYQLTRKPEEYTVGMILRLVEGDLAPVECLAEHAAPCQRGSVCSTLSLWKRIQDAIDGVINHVTLQDLVEEARQLSISGTGDASRNSSEINSESGPAD